MSAKLWVSVGTSCAADLGPAGRRCRRSGSAQAARPAMRGRRPSQALADRPFQAGEAVRRRRRARSPSGRSAPRSRRSTHWRAPARCSSSGSRSAVSARQPGAVGGPRVALAGRVAPQPQHGRAGRPPSRPRAARRSATEKLVERAQHVRLEHGAGRRRDPHVHRGQARGPSLENARVSRATGSFGST